MRGSENQFNLKVIGEYRGNPEVLTIVSHAARRVWLKYPEYVEFDDLHQEAFVLATTRPDLIEATEGEHYGYLQHRLELDLMNHCEMAFHVPWNNADGTVQRDDHSAVIREGRWQGEGDERRAIPLAHSYEALTEGGDDEDDYGHLTSHVVIETAANDYSRDAVENLLPAVWDEQYAYGMPQSDDAPDPDMPKGSTNKARGNNLSAYIADIKTGWTKTPLTLKQRRALLLAYGLDWSHAEIAAHEGVSEKTIQPRIDAAVGKIAAHLNGGYYYDPEEAVA